MATNMANLENDHNFKVYKLATPFFLVNVFKGKECNEGTKFIQRL